MGQTDDKKLAFKGHGKVVKRFQHGCECSVAVRSAYEGFEGRL